MGDPYSNETDLHHIPYPAAADISSASEESYRSKIVEWVTENFLRGLAGDDTDATISSGFAVSDDGGLDIEVSAGRGFIDGIPIHKATATSKAGLTDDDVNYIYLKLTATSDRDRTFTVEVDLVGAGMADAILIAAVTCASGDITDIDNTPSGRAPRIPQTWGGIPQFHVVATAGGDYTTLKAAVDAASAGDVIWVCAGTYTEAAAISSALNGLKIIGAGWNTILSFSSDVDGITLTGANCIIRDLKVYRSGSSTKEGIDVSGTDCRVENVFVEGFDSKGIYASGDGSIVDRCRVAADAGEAIDLGAGDRSRAVSCIVALSGTSGSGIEGVGDDQVAVGCHVSGGQYGYYFSTGSRARVANCTAVGADYYGIIVGGDRGQLLACTAVNTITYDGITFAGGNNGIAGECIAYGNNRYGVRLGATTNSCHVTGGIAMNNGSGGTSDSGTNNTIDHVKTA